MKMKQVSVFVENRPGRLKTLLSALAEAGISMRALSIADTTDFGIARMILSDTEKGLETIKQAGFTARTTDVLRVEIPDRAGGLVDTVITPLAGHGINIEYIYAFVDRPLEDAVVVLKVDDLDAAEKVIGQ